MHLALIGCSSVGKTTLARAIVAASRARGSDAWLSEDFALMRLRLGWIRGGFLRRRVLELAALIWLLTRWSRHRAFLHLTRRIVRDAPGGTLYRLSLIRLTLRKLGMHAIIEGAVQPDQLVVSHNEAVLQSAHHLFVHPPRVESGDPDPIDGALVEEFARLAPRPDLVAYVRLSSDVLVDRVVTRGHGRLGKISPDRARQFVERADEAFERLRVSPGVQDYLFVVDQKKTDGVVRAEEGDSTWPAPVRPLLAAAFESIERTIPSRGPRDVDPGAEILRTLVHRLDGEVEYCCVQGGHHRPASGRANHLSLLVSNADHPKAIGILTDLGFRASIAEGGNRRWSRTHFGIDDATGTLCSVRMATEALFRTGGWRGYRLPVERLLLGETERVGGLRVPSAPAALIVLILRTIIEAGYPRAIAAWDATRSSAHGELRRLAGWTSPDEVLSLVDAHCSWIGQELFLQCLNALFDQRPLPWLVRLSRRVRARVRRSGLGWTGAPPHGVVTWLDLGPGAEQGASRRTLHSGGGLIAFVGADATGKSTLARDLADFIEPAAEVVQVHLGKPRATLPTYPLNLALKILRAVRGRRPRWKPSTLPDAQGTRQRRVGADSLVYALRAVALAFERRRSVFKALRASTRGTVVVCDRFPTPVVGAMDGARLPPDPPGHGLTTWAYVKLARWEHRLYSNLPSPDVLVRLSVPIDVAQRRNRERDKSDKHTGEDLAGRHSQSPIAWPVAEDRILGVDTAGALGETSRTVRSAVWKCL